MVNGMSTMPAHVSVGEVEPFLGALQIFNYRWPNGLKLKVIPDPEAPVVAMQTWFGVGSADEQKGKTGLAHLFEHLMFKGTDGYADGELMARLEALGADGLNAWTWLDQTVYVEAVPKQALDEVARLESTRMDGLIVDEASFRSELDVVMNERRLSVDNEPSGKLSELLFSTAFEAHSYGPPTIGWMEDISAFQREDAEHFYRRYYAPDNATIILVGDVTPAEAVAVIDRHYAEIPASGVTRPPRTPEPEQTAAKQVEIALPIAADRVLIGFKVPSYTHDDIPALLVLDAALTAGRTGRMQRALRDPGFVADVSASVLPLSDPGLYEFVLQGRPGLAADGFMPAFWREIERVRREGLSAGELAMGIAQWESANWAQLESAAGKASFVGWSNTHTGRVADGLARIDAIRHVTLADCQRVAMKYLQPARSTTVIGRAESPSPAVPGPAPSDVVPADATHVAGRPLAPPPARVAGEVTQRVAHGATISSAWDPTIPLVQIRLFFPSGSALDPAAQGGLAAATGEMLLRGTSAHDRRSFEQALEQLGASVGVSVDGDGTTLVGSCLASTWPKFWSLVEQAIVEPRFDEDELALLLRETADELAALGDDDGELASAALRRALYPGHPLANDARGTLASLRRITVDDVRAFHAENIRSNGLIIGAAGAFDAGFDDDIDRLLSRIVGSPRSAPTAAIPASSRRIVLVDKPDRSQAQIVFGSTGIGHQGDDFAAFLLSNDAFGVGFGGRLFQEVRVKNGWSYFAYSYPVLRRGEGAWLGGLAPANAQAVDALALVLELCERTARDGFTADELEQVRAARLNGRPFLADTSRKRLELDLRRQVTGYDRIATTERMASVSLEEANLAFGRRVQPDRLIVAITGTAADLQGPLEARFGPIDIIPYRDLVGE
jgi:zinc protease